MTTAGTNRALLRSMLAIFFWTAAASALPLGQGEVGGQVGWDADVYDPAGAVEYNYPPSPLPGSGISGYADPGVLQFGTFGTGASAWGVKSASAEDAVESIDSYFGNMLTVLAGTSGKDTGDVTTLTLSFGLDGNTNVGGDRSTGYSSQVNVTSRFRLWDPSLEDCGEGCVPAYLVDFNAGIEHSETVDSATYLYNSDSWGWTLESWNEATSGYDVLDGDEGWDWYELQPNQTATCNSTPSNPDCRSFFDTGTVTVSIDTYVGAELYYYGKLSILSQARGGDASAYGNFLDTLGGSIAADDPGIELDFLLSVPEPSLVLLQAAASAVLMGLVAMRRGK